MSGGSDVSSSGIVSAIPAVIALVGATLLMTSLSVRWIAEGPGSSYSGFRLVNILRTGNARPDGSNIVTLSLAAVSGAAIVIAGTAPFSSAIARSVRGLVGIAVVLMLATAAVRGDFGLSNWAIGPWLALVGGVAAGASAISSGASFRTGRTKWRSTT